MKQMNKASRRWHLLFTLPLAGWLAMTAISAPAQAERLTSVTPASVSSGGTVTAHGQFNTRYIRDRRYQYHLSLYPRRGGSAIYLTITRSSATVLTATVSRRVAPGSYSLRVDMQRPGGGLLSFQQSNAIPITIIRAITSRPARPVQQVAGVIVPVSISSITPQILTPGDRLLIKGRGFGRSQQAGGRRNTILFSSRGGWVTIPVQSWSDTMIMTRPITHRPGPRNDPVTLHFYRNNRQVLTKSAYSTFFSPRIVGYEPAKVRPGDRVTVNVRNVPDGMSLRRFGVSLMRGNRQLASIPLDSLSRSLGKNSIVLHVPRNVEGNGLSIALYRKSDSKVVSNLLPGLDISRSAMTIRGRYNDSICNFRWQKFRIFGGPFKHNGRAISIRSEIRMEADRSTSSSVLPTIIVVSDTELEARVPPCLAIQRGVQLRLVYPDGTKSNWIDIEQYVVFR